LAEIGIFSLQIDKVIACLPSGRRVSILLILPKQSDAVVAWTCPALNLRAGQRLEFFLYKLL